MESALYTCFSKEEFQMPQAQDNYTEWEDFHGIWLPQL